MTKEQYYELKEKLSKISSVSRGISKAECNFTNSVYLHGTFSTEELIEVAGLVQEFSKTVDTGSYYNRELGMTINHPYGSDEYWNVYYYHFTKKMYEEQYGAGSWGNYWNAMHPDGPYVEKIEAKLDGIYDSGWVAVSETIQSPSSIKYISSIPSPRGTNMNVYHNMDTNKYVVEYPGSGSVWYFVDEATAKPIIEKSIIDEEHTKWVKEHFPLKKSELSMKNCMNQVQELTDRLKAIARRITEHGRDAAKKGIPIEDNPWKGFSHEFHIWRNGWLFETHKTHSKKRYENKISN